MLDVYENSNSTSRTTSDTMLINDETLAALVTPEGIIEIGEWIFKINPAKNLVTALNEKNETLYADLVNDVSNPNIYIFSTDDDILDLLENGYTQGSTSNLKTSFIFCGDGAAESLTISPTYKDPNDERELNGINAYKKFGVYFHLYTTAYLSGSKNGNLVIMHQHAYYYKTNCNNYTESGPYFFNDYLQADNYPYNGAYYDFKQHIYQSTRGLHDYQVISKYGYNAGTVITPLIEQH